MSSVISNLTLRDACRKGKHVRPCGPIPNEKVIRDWCACGCSRFDDQCGGNEWWLPNATMWTAYNNGILAREAIQKKLNALAEEMEALHGTKVI